MPIIEISSLSHPGIEVFSTLTEAQLRNRIEPDKGLFIAESPKVIRVAWMPDMNLWPSCASKNTSPVMPPTSSVVAATCPSIRADGSYSPR